ncbi:MAG: hypothetical protein L6R40_007977 [Gallowayella cf. fulva]|nr:MAG: hypothetical protein L6R40_007977 [Xanthomendoza cf. fulva]
MEQNTTLQVEFTWRKWNAYISNPSDPIYIVNYQCIKSPHLTIKSVNSDETIGTGTLHPISINAKFQVHGRNGTLKALKRWKTSYTHLSYAYSDSSDPVTMTWTSESGFKTWDFICLDDQQMPVAKFSANWWTLKKVGKIEFLGPKATSTAVREEIVVTGLTLLYCMLLRMNSLLSFFGAIIARPGPIKDDGQEDSVEQGVAIKDCSR